MDKCTEILKHVFNQDEKNELSSQMAQGITNLNTAENEKTAVMADYNSRIKALQAEVKSLASKIQSGFEMRPTKCRIEKDYQKGEVRIVRLDTGEMVKMRKMTDDDREVDLPGMPPDAPDFCENSECVNHDDTVNRCRLGLIYDSAGCHECAKLDNDMDDEGQDGPEVDADFIQDDDQDKAPEDSQESHHVCEMVLCKKYSETLDDHCFIGAVYGSPECEYDSTDMPPTDETRPAEPCIHNECENYDRAYPGNCFIEDHENCRFRKESGDA